MPPYCEEHKCHFSFNPTTLKYDCPECRKELVEANNPYQFTKEALEGSHEA